MNSHHFNGITKIQAESSAQNGIQIYVQDEDGTMTLVDIEVEPNLYPVRDLIVRAINSAARAAVPRPDAKIIGLPKRNGLAWGDPKAPLTSDRDRTLPLVRGAKIGMGTPPALVDGDGPEAA